MPRLRQFILFFGDLFCLFLGLSGALIFRYGFPIPSEQIMLHQSPFGIIFTLWLVILYGSGLYNLQQCQNNRVFFTLLLKIFLTNTAVAILFFYFVPFFAITPKILLFFDLVITAAVFFLWRMIFNSFVKLPPLKLAVIGSGVEVQEFLRDVEKYPQHGYACVLFINSEHKLSHLREKLQRKEIDAVVVTKDFRRTPALQRMLFENLPLRIQFFDFIDFYERYFQKVPHEVIDETWFLENLNEPGKHRFDTFKRGLDLFFVFLFGLASILILPVIILAMWIQGIRPFLFMQKRVGQFENPFRILKFRSMLEDNNPDTVTRVGRFLRCTHLDEIPQLWNIFKGEMSFVGPRPEQFAMVQNFKQKIPFYSQRFLVRPGITGWAQLHEPRAKAEDAFEKLRYDLFYIKHRSSLLDLEILLKTLRILLS